MQRAFGRPRVRVADRVAAPGGRARGGELEAGDRRAHAEDQEEGARQGQQEQEG